MVGAPALLTFSAAVLVLQVSPGPDMMLVIGRGVGQGRRIALLTAIGATALAGLIQLPLLALGIASLMRASPLAFASVRWTGAAYLLWLGIKLLLRARHAGFAARPTHSTSDGAALMQGMVNNLTNPKALIFMLVFLPQFVDPASGWPVAAQLLFLGALQKAMGFAVLAGVALGAGSLGAWVNRRPALIVWQERFTGLVLIGLGLRLALTKDLRVVRS